MTDEKHEITRVMVCGKCKGQKFRAFWKYEKKDEMNLYLAHEGFGFQLSDAILRCARCGSENQMTTEVI